MRRRGIRLPSVHRPAPTTLLLALLVLVSAAWIAYFGLRLHGLAIYDEKFSVEGARWLHGSIDRLWEVPGYGDRGVERLSAILFVPAIWLFSSTADQFVFDHLLMAVLLALEAVPAFLLARGLGASVRWSYFGAALAVFGSSAIYGTVLLNNAPAACAAAFALWSMWRAVTTPSPWWDALALVLLGLATLARVSSAVLFIAFPLAILARVAVTRRPSELRRHWLFGIVAVAGLVWLAAGHSKTLVGQYPTSIDRTGGEVAERLLVSVTHLSAATGVVVFPVAVAWILSQLRGRRMEATVFAVLALAYFAAVSYVNLASGIDERYEMVLFVPLAVALAVALSRREFQPVLIAILAALSWYALHKHGDIPWTQPSDYLTWPSREFLSKVWLTKAQYNLHIGRSTALNLIGAGALIAVVALAVVHGKWRRRLTLALAAFALVYSLAGSTWAMKKLSNTLRPGATFHGMSFVDELTGGERADAVGSTSETDSAIPQQWSEVQYFNGSVGHTISLEGKVYDLCCAPAGLDQVVAVDHDTGALSSDQPLPRWLLTVPRWAPAGFASELVFSSSVYYPNVQLERLPQHPMASYLSSGIDPYGWIRPRTRGRLRVFPAAAPATPACLRMAVTAPVSVDGGVVRWRVRGGATAEGSVRAKDSARVDVPLPGSRPLDLVLSGTGVGPDPVSGQPGVFGLSDLRLVRCGSAQPQPRPEP